MTKEQLKLIVPGVATITWGGVTVYYYASGIIERHSYLAEPFPLIALIGGLGMIVLGLFSILTSGVQTSCDHDHDHGHDHDHDDHDHEHENVNPLTVVLLMIFPVLLCAASSRHEYSDRALRFREASRARPSQDFISLSRRAFTREELENTTPKTEDGFYKLQFTELYWSSSDEQLMKVYDGLPAELQGRLVPEDDRFNPEGTRMRLYRIYMQCCAADAQVYAIPLQFKDKDSLPKYPARSWVRVDGTVAFERAEQGYDQAYLKVDDIEEANPPANASTIERR